MAWGDAWLKKITRAKQSQRLLKLLLLDTSLDKILAESTSFQLYLQAWHGGLMSTTGIRAVVGSKPGNKRSIFRVQSEFFKIVNVFGDFQKPGDLSFRHFSPISGWIVPPGICDSRKPVRIRKRLTLRIKLTAISVRAGCQDSAVHGFF